MCEPLSICSQAPHNDKLHEVITGYKQKVCSQCWKTRLAPNMVLDFLLALPGVNRRGGSSMLSTCPVPASVWASAAPACSCAHVYMLIECTHTHTKWMLTLLQHTPTSLPSTYFFLSFLPFSSFSLCLPLLLMSTLPLMAPPSSCSLTHVCVQCTNTHFVFYTVFLRAFSMFRYTNTYHCVPIAYSIQYSNMLYRPVAYTQ